MLPEWNRLSRTPSKKTTFMGTVLVDRDGKAILDKGYGSADLEWNIPNAPDTRFRLGSITKQFTAASILLLEERGKLKVEDPISKYMPDPPAAWKNITFVHLLSHTSGIPSFTSSPDYEQLQSRPVTSEQLVARFRDKPLDFQPGEKWPACISWRPNSSPRSLCKETTWLHRPHTSPLLQFCL